MQRKVIGVGGWVRSLGAVLGVVMVAGSAQAATIDTAQHSGVSGYPIGIFGTGFGATQGSGSVSIVGADATITKWTDTVIEAVVPEGTPGPGDLVVTASDASTAQSPFELYEVDPKFLLRPSDLINLAYKKTFVIDGTHNDWGGNPTSFLGYNAGTGDNNYAADFTAPISLVVDLGNALSEDVWFSFYVESDWYEGGSIPTGYSIDASADSTNGTDGTWDTLLIITDNARKSRIHKVTFAGQHWIRMHVTEASADTFGTAEIRVYKRNAPGGTGIDCIGIMGDSITFGDHKLTGPGTMYELIQEGKDDGTVPAAYFMGLIGAGTDSLAAGANSVATALELTPDIHFFGIAFGTNPHAGNKEAFSAAVTELIDAEKVPILARMPDTDNNNGGYGTAEYKKQTLQEIDEVAAEFKLIPGPDFYTPFRQNLGTYLSDGTHHTAAGAAVERQLWADTFLRSGAYSGELAPPVDGSGGAGGTGGAATAGAGGVAAGTGGAATAGSGGASAAGGAAGNSGSAGSAGSSSAGAAGAGNGSDSCGCRTAGSASTHSGWWMVALGALSLQLRRRRPQA